MVRGFVCLGVEGGFHGRIDEDFPGWKLGHWLLMNWVDDTINNIYNILGLQNPLIHNFCV